MVPEKNPYPSHGRSPDIPGGKKVLKAKILEAKYEAQMEFPGGKGVQNKKNFRQGSMDTFWNYTINKK